MEEQTPKKKKLSKIKIFVIGIISIVILGIIIGFLGTQAPTKAARAFVQSAINGEAQKIYDDSYSEFKKNTTFEQFNTGLQSLSSFRSNPNISFTNKSIQNNLAEIDGTVKGENGQKASVRVQLIKTTNGWKISAFEWKSLNN